MDFQILKPSKRRPHILVKPEESSTISRVSSGVLLIPSIIFVALTDKFTRRFCQKSRIDAARDAQPDSLHGRLQLFGKNYLEKEGLFS